MTGSYSRSGSSRRYRASSRCLYLFWSFPSRCWHLQTGRYRHFFISDGHRSPNGKGLGHHGRRLDGAFQRPRDSQPKSWPRLWIGLRHWRKDHWWTLGVRSQPRARNHHGQKSWRVWPQKIPDRNTAENFTQPCLSDRRTTSLLLRSE